MRKVFTKDGAVILLVRCKCGCPAWATSYYFDNEEKYYQRRELKRYMSSYVDNIPAYEDALTLRGWTLVEER